MTNCLPILYSFRRCPYAIRSRMALRYAGVECELREVVLKSKPQAMLDASPKGTVPVLLLDVDTAQPTVVDQSIDIIAWALSQSDPDNYQRFSINDELIVRCDDEFKFWLDRYKYADRFPEKTEQFYFDKACVFLRELESIMLESDIDESNYFIRSDSISVLDIAIFPFIRQFSFVDKPQFERLNFPKIQAWLEYCLNADLFTSVMEKYTMWVEGESTKVIFNQT